MTDERKQKCRVAVVAGSDSDAPLVKEVINALKEYGIECSVHVISAHRSPALAHEFAAGAKEAGYEVIIAVAGGAAHLAGTLAARTTLPVIGVPVPTELMGGLDSLLSVAQMPAGVPVAAVGVGKAGARNAGVLAAQILALKDERIAKQLESMKAKMAKQVQEKEAKLRKLLQGGD